MSVIRAVDGQDTGLSAQPAEQPTSDQHRPGLHLQSALVQASLLLKHQPTGQLKRTRPLTSSSERHRLLCQSPQEPLLVVDITSACGHKKKKNGDTGNHQNLPPTRGVGYLYSFQGCLLPYTNTGTVQEISEVSCTGLVNLEK